MIYRHKITGAEFVTNCICCGNHWEPVEAPNAPAQEKPKKAKKEKKQDETIRDAG